MEPIKVSKDPVSSHIISIDIGLDGGIYKNGIAYPMPTTEIILKAPVMVQALDKDGKKVIIKSGPDKGQVKMKIKTPAVTKRELDVFKIKDLFESNDKHTIVLELPGNSIGNSARSSSTTDRNFGKLLAIAELSGANVVTVSANQWKKALNLSKDKIDSINLAEQLSGALFRSTKNKLYDGLAESLLIGYYYSEKIKSNLF